jgi:hypothetical protein
LVSQALCTARRCSSGETEVGEYAGWWHATLGGDRMDRCRSCPRIIARHPVVTFMIIGLGAGFLTAAIPPIVNSEILPFDLPLHGVLGGVLGVGIGAFLVTAALAGRDGVVDLARRSTRWRVPVRWYLVAHSPSRSGQPLSHWPSTARKRSHHPPVAGPEHWRRWPRSSCSSSCSFSSPKRSDSPDSSSPPGKTGITP